MRPELRDILHACCRVTLADYDRVTAQGAYGLRYKDPTVSEARALFAAAAHELGYSFPTMARFLGCHHATMVLANQKVKESTAYGDQLKKILDDLAAKDGGGREAVAEGTGAAND